MELKYRNCKDGNFIHPTAVISPLAKIGKNNFIGPYCVIQRDVIIGDNNIFESHVSVGSPAEHKSPEFNRNNNMQEGKVIIGDNNNIREFVTINKPTLTMTSVGSNCYIMRGGHISHDTQVEDDVIMSCDVILGGHSIIMKGAYMGIKSCTHPRIVVGHYSMIGMGSVVTKNIPPMCKAYGIPAKEHGDNTVGIERARLGFEEINNCFKIYKETINEKN